MYKYFLGVIAACMLLPGFADAATLVVGADADAHVQSGASGNTNFGGSTFLQIKSTADANFRRKTYVRFDLGGVDSYQSGQLDLTIDGFAGTNTAFNWDFDVFGLVDSAVGNNWGEGTITYNNAPGNDTGGNGVLAGQVFNSAPIAEFSISAAGTSGDVISLDTASFPDLLDFLNSDTDGLVTFIIARETIGDGGNPNTVHQLVSRENSTGGPVLTLETVVPEPASMFLWGLIAIVFGFLYRKHRTR